MVFFLLFQSEIPAAFFLWELCTVSSDLVDEYSCISDLEYPLDANVIVALYVSLVFQLTTNKHT